jgi:dTMP kinase
VFITFEGIDGSGKSTQIQLLKQQLAGQGFSVQVFREPGGTEVSEIVRGLLLQPDVNIQPAAEILLFSAARAQLISEKVKPLLAKDVVVILDRFYDSTVAYQGYGRSVLPLKDVHKLNEIASRGITPDITFYLQLSLQDAQKRTNHKKKDRIELAGREFYERVIQGFEELAREEDRIIAVDASAGRGEIHQFIMEKIRKRFPGDGY